jgi:acyl-CoA thioesterase
MTVHPSSVLPAVDQAQTPLERALSVDHLGRGRARATLDRSWFSWAGPHGGLVAALLLRAASALAGEGRIPRSLTAQFLAAAPEGRPELSARLLREGGSSSVVSAELYGDDGQVAALAVLTSGRGRPSGSSYRAVVAPTVPRPEECARLVLPVEFVPFSQHMEFRPATPQQPLAGGGVAELQAWVRPVAGGRIDAAALTLLADVLPPGLYGATSTPVPVPTVELAVSFTGAEPQGEWLLARITTLTAADGWCLDDSEVWDETGQLLVQARQTRRVLGQVVL